MLMGLPNHHIAFISRIYIKSCLSEGQICRLDFLRDLQSNFDTSNAILLVVALRASNNKLLHVTTDSPHYEYYYSFDADYQSNCYLLDTANIINRCMKCFILI